MDEEIFCRVRAAYTRIWHGPDAGEVDFGARPVHDALYAAMLESDEWQDILAAGRLCVVDLGAGRGSRLVRQLATRPGVTVVAVDCCLSFGAPNLAFPAGRLVADVRRPPLRDDCADVVVSAYVTVNNALFDTVDARRGYVREIVRLLRPGGLFWGEEPGLLPDEVTSQPGVTDYTGVDWAHVHCFRRA
ncbi:MAG: class I SAM-dependent methyltransferase [Acidobacteria bacterium]|nr:class I SAM-dependent methyltransferase [Acidobacteriota bacterium]